MSASPNGQIGLTATVARPPGLGRVLWDAWKAYTRRGGSYQTTVLLSAIYYLVLGPSALFARLAGKRLLDLDSRPRATYWIERPPAEKTLESVGRQF